MLRVVTAVTVGDEAQRAGDQGGRFMTAPGRAPLAARRRRRTAAAAAGLLGAALLPLLPGSPATADTASVTPPASVTLPASLTLPAAAALPYQDAALPVEQRVADLLGRMTLQEKVGQMTQAERAAVETDGDMIRTLGLGSVLSGGGSTPAVNTPEAWADMVDRFQAQALQTRLGIPLIYGVDAVHGHGNVRGATLFPHNIGMGATRDPALAEAEGRVTGAEVRATGIPWDFAPCLCVTRDERWGRSYESFGEDPALVTKMETVIDGLQGTEEGDLAGGEHVLATVKHFAGDGDTDYGTGSGDYTIDQGITETTRKDFERIDLAPYVPAIEEHDARSVMPSFSSVDFTDDEVGPVKMHGNRDLLTGVLKEQMDFDGFIISDWEGIHQLPGEYAAQVATGINAGIDMAMEPNSAPAFAQTLLAQVASGAVPQARIDDAVSRILTQKFALGLFEHPFADRTGLADVGSAEHRELARQAAGASQVLLKNSGGALPLAKDANIYVAGRSANDMGNQLGGWSLTWQGFSGTAAQQPGTTILEGIREVAPTAGVTYSRDASAPTAGSDVGVVVVGETPYAEGFGDVGGPEWGYDPADAGRLREEKSLQLQAEDKATVDKVCTVLPTCVVLVVSGRTQVLSDQLPVMDALVASWLPGTEGAGVADVLFGDRPFTGQLPVSWPRSEAQVPVDVGDLEYDPAFPFGWGLRTDSGRARLATEVIALRDRSQDADVRAALQYVRRADRAAYWDADGNVKDAAAVVLLLQRAADRLALSPLDTAALQGAVASVARDVAQEALLAGRARPGASALFAQADVALLEGHVDEAVSQLALAAGPLPISSARAATLSAL